MPTTLTAAVTRSATNVTIDDIEIQLVRNANFTVNLADSRLTVQFAFRRADGVVVENRTLSRAGADVPVAIRNAIVALQNAILTAARAANIVPAGTDTADL